jgi:iron complex outermembrane receptor protein
LWSTYEFQSGGLQGFGMVGGAQYVGTREGNNTNTYRLSAYTRFDAGIFYKFERLTARLSVNNITDEEILVSQGGNFLFPGEPRSLLLSAWMQF